MVDATTVVTTTQGIPWEAVAAALITAISAFAAYLNQKRQEQDKKAVGLAKDSEFQKEAVMDLAVFAAKAFAANADCKITKEEYDQLMAEGKVLAQKYGDKFGVGSQISSILATFTPSTPAPPVVAVAVVEKEKEKEETPEPPSS